MTAKPLARPVVAILAVVLASTVSLTGDSWPADAVGGGPKPTVVLVHGAWADASGWGAVTERLQHDGYTVIAPANPLRSVTGDAAYLSTVLATISGPLVLVGHSYGGVAITNAAASNSNVKALVYIAAFAPEAGETLAQILAKNPGSQAGPPNLTFRPYPGGLDTYIAPNVFHKVFCADVADDTRNERADQFGVRQVELYHNADGQVYCLLDGPDEDAIRKHHAALGVDCGTVHRVDGIT